jgi:nitroreductase
VDVYEAMMTRRSVRTYRREPVPSALLDRVARAFAAADRLNDVPVRLLLVPAERVAPAMTGLVGSYGAMKDPPTYAIGTSRAGEHDQVNFGFVMEQFVLACAREGLGTCWVGGFFKKSRMNEAVPLPPGERIVCVSPVGHPAERRFAERSMRALGGLNARKPLAELVFDGRWGTPASAFLAARPDLARVFEAARWAPSASNGQPARYVVDDGRIVVCLTRPRSARYADALGKDRAEGLDFRGVDAGIAIAHVHLAARHVGAAARFSFSRDDAALRERHAVPEGTAIVGAFEFGGRGG